MSAPEMYECRDCGASWSEKKAKRCLNCSSKNIYVWWSPKKNSKEKKNGFEGHQAFTNINILRSPDLHLEKDNMPNIDDIENIYFHFRKAQADYNNRGFRMPKKFEEHFKKKLTEINQKKLINITNWFNTKWSNIDPYIYFECGFILYKKRFTYVKFFNEKVLKLYIQKDKNKKREARVTKEKLIESAKFIKNYMRKNEISTLQEYIDTQDGNQKIAVSHYLKNNIDASFFVFLLKKGMILTDVDRGLIPYISKNYRNINIMLIDMKIFVDKIEKLL